MSNRPTKRNQINRLSKISYWQSQSRWLKTKFEFSKRLYKVQESIRYAQRDTVIFRLLVQSSLAPLIFSVLCLIALILLPFPDIKPDYVDNYDNFLIAAASITGIFLSLYFTGLNTVISGLYSKSPRTVFLLVIQEQVSHFSVRFLVFFTLICLELLFVGIVFDSRLVSSISVVAILGCLSILFFVRLGWSVFNFLDTSPLVDQAKSEIIKWASYSSKSGFEFQSPSFQEHYRKQAENALMGFQGIIDLSKSEKHLIGTLSETFSQIQNLYVRYLWIKRSIPTKSRWFLYSPKFQDWYMASEHMVRIANITQTDLQPQIEPNQEWLEEKLENLEIEVFLYAIEQNQWETAQVILARIFDQFSAAGRVGEIKRAFGFLHKYKEVVDKLLSDPISAPSKWNGEDIRTKLSALQVLVALLTTLAADLFNSLGKIDFDDLKKKISSQNWSKPNAPYTLDLPFRLLKRLEDIHNGLNFEISVEGQVVSPSWYITELVLQEYSFYLKEVSNKILLDGVDFVEKIIKSYEDGKRFVEVSIVASSALELEAKSRHLLSVVKGVDEKLSKERSIENLPWAEWNWEEYREKLTSFRERMVVAQVSHLGGLFTWKEPSDFPDYFGKGVVLAGEECLKSLRANNAEYFATLFPKYFGGILLTFEKIRVNNQNLRPEQFLLLLTEPIMDLLDVSGYSLIYSEYHQNEELWKPCKVAWDDLVKKQGREYLERLAMLIQNKKFSFGATNRDFSRSQWEIEFNASMRLLPRKHEKIERGVVPIGLSIIDHPSELIREIGGTHDRYSSVYDSDEVFIDIFLSTLPEASGLDFGIRHKITESISRKKKRKKKSNG
ncbi:MAG: hypothetical protein IPP66_22400 [Anaerolineales bacterium]|nr:hypothetical protein [Anaerolineales bacterium]